MISWITMALLISAVLAVPAWLRTESRWVFLLTMVKVAFLILLPPLVFMAASCFVPDWKGGCKYGWVDCFHAGKLALLPIVLWATAALYAVEVRDLQYRTRRWVVLGLFLGFITSLVCFIHGVLTINYSVGMNIPLYVTAWYGWRMTQAMKSSHLRPWAYLGSLLSSAPCWALSVYCSLQKWASLPNDPPNCFVVTAAANGHETVVGPWFTIIRHGQPRRVNAQLMTFWQLEEHWRKKHPHSHRHFRAVYNLLGYQASRWIANRWVADAVFISLKPIEWMAARVILKCENQ